MPSRTWNRRQTQKWCDSPISAQFVGNFQSSTDGLPTRWKGRGLRGLPHLTESHIIMKMLLILCFVTRVNRQFFFWGIAHLPPWKELCSPLVPHPTCLSQPWDGGIFCVCVFYLLVGHIHHSAFVSQDPNNNERVDPKWLEGTFGTECPCWGRGRCMNHFPRQQLVVGVCRWHLCSLWTPGSAQGLIQGRLFWAHRQGISTLSPSLSKIIKDFLGTDSLPQPFPTSVFENASMGDWKVSTRMMG